MPEQNLTSPKTVRDLLERYNLRADKSFGQNFLVDYNVLMSIVETANLSAQDHVLEIGPGLGVLTRELATRAGQVSSVELDARVLPVLAETVGDYANVRILHEDGLKVALELFPQGSLLVANLPYNVATPIIVRVLESCRFKRLVFLVQKEVAQRLSADPSDEGFGALSLVVAHFGSAKRIRDVKPSAFLPPPSVTSSVVQIEVNPNAKPAPALFDFIHTCFRHRRKTLQKNLVMAGYNKDRVVTTLEELGLDLRLRAEALDLAHFKNLFQTLQTHDIR